MLSRPSVGSMIGRYWDVQNGVLGTNHLLVCKWGCAETQAVGKNVFFIRQIPVKTSIKDQNKNSTGVSLENFEIISSEESTIAWISSCSKSSSNWSKREFKHTVTVLISYDDKKFIEYCLQIDRLFDAKLDQCCREELIFHDCWDPLGEQVFVHCTLFEGRLPCSAAGGKDN